MATKVSVFNTAMGYMGLPPFTSPDDDDENGRTLRSHWESAVNTCFEAGGWNFAAKRVELARSAAVPAFGYQYYYGLPADWQRLLFVSESGYERDPLLFYEEEDGKIACDSERIYIKYVSNTLRFAVGSWSQAFADYVSAELADRSAAKLAHDKVEDCSKRLKKNKSNALSIDAVVQPGKFRRPGRWVTSNRGRFASRENGRG